MKAFEPQWFTTKEFAEITPLCLYHREQEPGPGAFGGLQNLHVLARAAAKLKKKPAGPIFLRVTGDDYYKAYVNGRFVGQGPAPAGPEQYYYNQMEISGLLTQGENIIGIHLYYQGLINRVFYSGDGRLGLAGELVDQEGNPAGKLRWQYRYCRAYEGEVIGYDTQFLENFDSRRWDPCWNTKACSSEPWELMERAKWADYRMVSSPAVQVQVREIEPASVRREGNLWHIDMGREIAGALRLEAVGKSGRKVKIRCGEELTEDGQVRWNMRCGCSYEETWTLADGVSVYEPFDYKGFRYGVLEAEEGVEIRRIMAMERHYPIDPEAFSFRSSNKYLEGIIGICRQGVVNSTQEGFLDCPTREKGQYLGDALVTARSHIWLSGSTGLLRKCLRQFAATKDVCPGLLAVAPGGLMQEIGDFSLLWGELLMLDYSFTGDREFLSSLYPAAREILQYFQKYADRDGLLNQVGEKWNLVDWPENLRDGYDFPLTRPVVGEGCHNVINALYVGAAKTLCQMEDILGIKRSMDWEGLKEAFVEHFYDRERKLFTDRPGGSHASLHSNIYPLYFGLTSREDEGRAVDFLMEKGLSCGVFLSYFYLKALCRAGKWKEAWAVVLNETERGWVNMIREGATACFEAWGKDQKWNTSLCHPWASAPISVLVEEFAGFHLCPETEEGFVFEPGIGAPLLPREFSLAFPFRGRRWRIENEEGALVLSEES